MAHLWYVTLGNLALCAPGFEICDDFYPAGRQPGWGLTNTGDFKNMQSGELLSNSGSYWLDKLEGVLPGAWAFNVTTGAQFENPTTDAIYAMAVHPGDVVAGVPEPSTYALMLAGLGLIGFASRRRNAPIQAA